MVRKKQSRGQCGYCGKTYTRGGMSRHLQACSQRQEAIANAAHGEPQSIFYLQISDAYNSDFWLYLEMAGDQSLKELDRYLRGIWLECCGHLSKFFLGSAWSQTVSMSKKAVHVFAPEDRLTHIYDFGTSSETVIKVVAQRHGRATTSHPIALIARNDMPTYDCQECAETATHLCTECWDDENSGLLCDVHLKGHPHVDYALLPLVNSPRVGMCGYDGSAEPPY